ncbi:MAG TPA: bifunctional (p)ppGpp synthetase/guanosine-3',5'-bis(diphosphate) 3'-pyrophosphohydrolase [Syntrophaceae bacterium]|nr:bifunctional (p)ppGpp synthetase/guanosine-3',5'-bis(diphosphate) 3'-pyrophosphohydrolase [Syntrophaceae bacterium]
MIRLNDILDKVTSYYPKADLSLIEKAYIFSAKVHEGQVRLSGEPYLSHPLEVANVLANMRLDIVTIASGLLHDVLEDTKATVDEVQELFGKEVATIVGGVTKISKMSFLDREERHAENIKKMILAMAQDIRVIMVKLADRVHNMRTLGYHSPEKQRHIARETLDIYAPLAGRLGIRKIQVELEDLALYYLEPEIYTQISSGIARRRGERERYIAEVKDIIQQKMREFGLQVKVEGRPKHLYSIYRKMMDQNLSLDELYDIIAFRIILNTVKECYEALGVIHSLWKPIAGKFKDYISLPKTNMYQSLHTKVIGPYGERMEIQIRTQEMHRVAEEGIAAHWRYKEGGNTNESDTLMFAWLRQLINWQRDLKDPREFLESVKVDLFPQEVYVFTPKGDVKEFPYGATPVDFAYSIHTEVGHKCSGAKVNGKLVPLDYQLKNGDIVEIITSPHHVPSKDWLKFVKTSKARTRIKQWVKTEEREQSIILGRELCEKEFRKHGLNFTKYLKSEELTKAASELSIQSVDDLLASVGYGKISPRHVIGKLIPREQLDSGKATALERLVQKVIKRRDKGGIKVKGIGDVMIRVGRCCNPLPGDAIIGYITRGRGITVHTSDCPNIVTEDSERRVDVEWEVSKDILHPVKIQVISFDKKGLLADISGVISQCEANILEADVHTSPDKKAVSNFIIEVTDAKHLSAVITSLKKLKDVIRVKRLVT